MTNGIYRAVALAIGVLAAATPPLVMAQSAHSLELLSRGDTARAIAQLESELGKNPFDPVVLNNLAVAYGDKADFSRAGELLRRAHRLAPADSVIRRNLYAVEQWQAYMAQRSEQAELTRGTRDGSDPRIPPEPPALWR